MGKWQVGIVIGFLIVYSITVVATGNAIYIIPVLILAVILLAYAGLNRALTKREYDKHGGDIQAEMADNEDPIPSTHLIPDDTRPAGDTPEAHDELSPHDVPIGSPVRQTVEAQAGGEGGHTRGNTEGASGGPAPETQVEDGTDARTGEPQRSASDAK